MTSRKSAVAYARPTKLIDAKFPLPSVPPIDRLQPLNHSVEWRSERHRAAAINIPGRADDVARSLGGHEGDDRADLVRAPHATNRKPGNALLAHLRFGLAGHLRPFPHRLLLALGVDDVR